MPSQWFVSVLPMAIWFWLILFASLSTVASFECYQCYSRCENGGEKIDCTNGLVKLSPPSDNEKFVCIKNSKDGKITSKECEKVPKDHKDSCYVKEAPSEDFTRKVQEVECVCSEDSCNEGTNPGSGNAGTRLMAWSIPMWIGLGCLQIILSSSSRRCVSFLSKSIWFWLILLVCFRMAASIQCYECYSPGSRGEGACGKEDKTDCDKTYGRNSGLESLSDYEKYACVTESADGKVVEKSCERVPKTFNGDCYEGEGHNSKYTKRYKVKKCYCVADLCNAGAGTNPTSLFIGGLACLSMYTYVIRCK